MGNRCCSLCSSSENEDMKAIGDVIEMVQHVGQVDQLISSIEDGLNALEKRLQEKSSTSTQGIASSPRVPAFKLGKYLLEKGSKRVDRQGCKMCCMSKFSRETKVVAEVLKEVADIHWLVAGLSLVAYVMEQFDQVSENKSQCVQLLRYSCALAKHVKELNRHLPQEKKKLSDAVQMIVEGSLMCLAQMQSNEFSRFLYASIDGADLENFQNQIRQAYPDLILTAVTAVLNQIPVVLPPSQGDDPNAVGIEAARERVIELLSLDTIDQTRRAVVVYGVGGVGKTTLATAVFNKLDLQGTYMFCRVFMDENCSPQHLKLLQQQILDDLFGKKIQLRDNIEGREQLRKAFGEAKQPLFMFIDNALRKADLGQLLPADLSCISQQMRILITTRKLDQTDFLLQPHIQRFDYCVNFLSSAESEKILSKIALGNVDASFPEGLNVDEAVEMCGGIPLVLELVGSQLKMFVNDVSDCNRLLHDMKQRLEKGERDMSEKVVDVVFNSLDADCKDSFLDIACFFNNKPRRIVAYIVGNPQLKALQDAALVKVFPDSEVSDYEGIYCWDDYIKEADGKEGILKVHDVVRARARNLSESKRITDMQSLLEAIEDKQEIKGIWLPDFDYHPLELQAEQVDRMHESLRVLNLRRPIQVNGRCKRNFENLRFLSLGIHTFPVGIDLSKAKQRAFLNYGFSSRFTGNHSYELPASLYVVRSESADPINVLDQCHSLSSLEELQFTGCKHNLSESFGNLKSLRFLSFQKSSFPALPESFGQLKSLSVLNLSDCRTLAALPERFGDLFSLAKLILDGCFELVSLPANFGQLKLLRDLSLRRCFELITLPESFGNLSALKRLDLEHCSQLTTLPESFGNLCSLKSLNLWGCSQLTTLPESFGSLCTLENLDLRYCSQFNTLPESFGNLYPLKRLNLWYCKHLVTLPESFGKLCALESLELMNSSQLITLPKSFGNLCGLKSLNLSNCSQLTTLPESFGNLCSLKNLDLTHCSHLTTLCQSFGNLCALKILNLENCSQLTTLPESFGSLCGLELLCLTACSNLTSLPESCIQLSNLQRLDMRRCEKVLNLPDKFGQLTSLECLNIESCTAMERLPADFRYLTSLTYLNAKCCSQLVGEAIDTLVEMKNNSVVLEINETPLMIPPWKLKQLMEHHILFVSCETWERACAETECTALSHSASRFLHVNDNCQVADWQPREFAGTHENWALLFTMYDLSSTSNTNFFQRLEERTGRSFFFRLNIMYEVVGELKDESEERICGTLRQIWQPYINRGNRVSAWIPPQEVSIQPTAPCWFASLVF